MDEANFAGIKKGCAIMNVAEHVKIREREMLIVVWVEYLKPFTATGPLSKEPSPAWLPLWMYGMICIH